MVNQDLTAIDEITNPLAADIAYTVNDPLAAKTPKRSTWANILKIYNAITATLTNKTQSVDLNSIIQDIPVAGEYLKDDGTKFVPANFDTDVSANSDVTANTAKVTNATHTGDVTGSTALTIGTSKVTNDMLFGSIANGKLATDPLARANHTGTQSATTIGSGDLADARMKLKKEVIMLALTTDPTTAVTSGTDKVSFRLPFAFTLTEVIVSAHAHGTTSTMTVDINDDGVSINGAPISLTTTDKVNQAASTQVFADDSIVTVDVDAAGTDVQGVVVYLVGHQ